MLRLGDHVILDRKYLDLTDFDDPFSQMLSGSYQYAMAMLFSLVKNCSQVLETREHANASLPA